MATPFPTDLMAAPTGGAIAWVSSNSGVHNILIATARTGMPAHRSQMARRHELHRRRRAVDHRAGLHERRARRSSTCAATARTARANRRIPRSCRTAPIKRCSRCRSPAERRSGSDPAAASCASPRGQRVAWVSRGQIWSADLASDRRSRRGWSMRAAARRDCRGRRMDRCSPSRAAAARTATSASSRSHRSELRYIDPSLDRDGNAVWSPDGSRIAWIRQGAAPRARMFSPRREVDEPWSLRVADVKTGMAKQVWKADAGYGSAFQGSGRRQPAVLGRGRSAGLPVGEGRLAASVFGAGRGRQGDAADAGQLRSRVREHRVRTARG